MKAFVLACVAAIIIAVIGGFVLDSQQETAQQGYATNYVRLGA